jgi:hypothetical protein
MKNYASNKAELAKLVGLSRLGLERYFRTPDHPETRQDGRHTVSEWVSFIQAHRISPNGKRNGNHAEFEPSEREKAITAKNLIEAERARFKLKVEVGEFLPRQDVCLQVETVHSTVRRELNKKLLHEMPPRLEGLKAIEMKRPIRQIVNELSDQLCGQLSNYAMGLRHEKW